MSKVSKEDYEHLDLYVQKVLQRAGIADDRMAEATEALMHPITALVDDGPGSQEFIPYMKMRLRQWIGPDAGR
ncbi:hypothetical protein [Tianweitania sp.]|uniref:hypothetical protein n=1 Tax=Tianweitania sp. TaxID=2021634 RepID=UPI0028A15808|nr:hypothetical protein [Tianweitania sp.]